MILLPIHIIAGLVGIAAGYVALYVFKGAALHRKSGMVFVYAMLAMSLLGALMAAVRSKAPAANVPVGLLTAYLVITGVTTVRPYTRTSWLDRGSLLLAITVTLALFTFGFEALARPNGRLQGMPAAPFFVFGTLGLLASAGDIRMMRSGGIQTLAGAPRLARHLWRMSGALAIAAFSFFLGQAKVIPKPIRIVPLLAMPPLLVVGAIVYWLWRLRTRRSVRGSAGVASLLPPASALPATPSRLVGQL